MVNLSGSPDAIWLGIDLGKCPCDGRIGRWQGAWFLSHAAVVGAAQAAMAPARAR